MSPNLVKVRAIISANSKRAAGDRRVQISFVVLPVAIILLVGALFGSGGRRLPVGILVVQKGVFASRIVQQVKASPALQYRSYSHPDQLRRDVRRGRIVAGAIVPANLDATLPSGSADLTLVAQVDRPEALSARLDLVRIADTVGAEVTAARLATQTGGPTFAQAFSRATAATDAAEAAARRATHSQPVSAFSYTSPANLVLFVFLIAMATSAGTVATRQLGITRRMLASPTPPWVLVVSGAVTLWILTIFQALFLITVGTVMFGVRWGNPIALVMLVLAATLAATGAGSLLGAVARTQEQALSLAVPLGIGLGMLGGCMWSLDSVGPTMRAVGHAVPEAWAMDGFIRLVFHHGSVGSVAGPVLVLLAYAAALLTLASWLTRRTIVAV
jgi:ABC-2 type transport system permease protein